MRVQPGRMLTGGCLLVGLLVVSGCKSTSLAREANDAPLELAALEAFARIATERGDEAAEGLWAGVEELEFGSLEGEGLPRSQSSGEGCDEAADGVVIELISPAEAVEDLGLGLT